MTTEIKQIAAPEELSYELAYRAYSNISFSAENRAKDEQENFADHVNSFYTLLANEFSNQEQVTYLETAILEYKATYLNKYGSYLSSLSRVASVMIAGPSNFATNRNQKRATNSETRLSEFIQWRDKAEKSIRQHLLSLQNDNQIIEAAWEKISLEIKRSLGVIHDIDNGRAWWSRAAFVNSIVGMVKTQAEKGNVTIVERALQLVNAYNEKNVKPAIGPKHKFWLLVEIAKAKATNDNDDAA